MESLAGQLSALGMTILAGACLGLLFDVYRVIRTVLRLDSFVTHLTDLLFWLVAAPTVFLLLLLGNWGRLRLYVFLGLGVGLLLYTQILSPLMLRLLFAITSLIGGLVVLVVSLIWALLNLPFRLVREARLRYRHGFASSMFTYPFGGGGFIGWVRPAAVDFSPWRRLLSRRPR